MKWIAKFAAWLITKLAWLLTGFQATWRTPLDNKARVYVANHRSHTDFVLLWAALPKELRQYTRPVAGADYWSASLLRRFIGRDVFNAVLIPRGDASQREQIQELMQSALLQGESLILFPEGTRNLTEELLLPFKSGIYHLAKATANLEIVPVWLDNLGRVMPKGALLPAPLLCAIHFGEPLYLQPNEEKNEFLERLRTKLLALSAQQ
jgi:1-acyl-sn-glycerol-3-phosphate acyltransferase